MDTVRNDIARFNARTERFHKETGVWPPGRDRPSAKAEDPRDEVGRIRLAFYTYWCEQQKPLTEHPDVQRLIKEVVKLQLENTRLKD